jgi:NAD(P)-dependent dehydrogenase (short-subunit alcohol dehydrogenase family)
LALAKAGADIAVVYRKDEEAANETVREIQRLSRKAAAFRAEAGDYESVKEAVNLAIAFFGKIDILVNNAGIASRGNAVYDTDAQEMERVMKTHVFGSFYFTQALLPILRQQPRGDILFISSIAVELMMPNGSPYNMAKTALEALALTLAKEEVGQGIHVNVIRPGLVETDMGSRLARATRGVKDIKDLYATSPFGRVGQPEDIGNAVVFLASEKAAYITGTIIKVSGGD